MTGDLKTPGELLQEARKARGLSLADLSAKTKIPNRILEAIELDDYQKVSGALYVRSFLRTYAEYVGIDPQEILDLYQRHPSASEGAGDPATAQLQGDLKIQETPIPNITPQTIAKPPLDEEAVGGDVWKEDVQVRHIGISGRSRILLGLGLLAVIVIVVLLVSKGLRRDHSEVDQQTEALATEPISDHSESAEQQQIGELPPEPVPGSETAELAVADPQIPDSSPIRSERPDDLASEADASEAPQDVAMGYPRALRGDSTLVFAGGRLNKQVVRVICDVPQAVEVRWFGIRQPLTAVWLSDPAPLPTQGIEPGLGYRVAEGLVIYWGSDYDIEIKIPRTSGVSVTLNGESVSLDEAAVGRWRLLNPSVVGRQ